MAPYNPMKKHMDKLDEWGSAQSKKFTSGRDAGPGASVTDRFNLARGKDDRWERSKPVRPDEDQTNIVPHRSNRVDHLPQAPPSFVGGKAPPPPPPQRGLSNGSTVPPPPPPPQRGPGAGASVPPPAPARGKAPPPVLPRRMDNENGIDRPPPDYGSSTAATSSAGPDYIQFSAFTEQDKQAFFLLLDEFFASRSNTTPSSGKSSLRNGRSIVSANDTSFVQTKVTEEPAKASGPGAKPSIFNRPQQASPTRPGPAPAPSPSSHAYPRLSASSLASTELCTALTCATFLCYPDSYPEWSGAQPWFVLPNAVPTSIKGRKDVAYSVSSMYRGNDHSLFGGALFSDLSYLWWCISWNSTSPAQSVKRKVAYKLPPDAWNDEERLSEANRGFRDWIAGFAETHAANQTPVGDGECWTLAADAIKYTNETAGLDASNRLMTTIGRTHGHLIFAGKADEVNGQCGRWRGGDRFASRGGGVRRGDIVEWKSAKCRVQGAPVGSYVMLGAPEHTAIIVEDSPVPSRLEERGTRSSSGGMKGDYYSILGVGRKAGQAEIRAAYLQGARRHHPDKQTGVQDDFIQKLNEAHATLSDPALRARYDGQLQGQGSSANVTRVTAEVDLDSFEPVDEPGSDSLTFYYPCRCGNGFYIDEGQMQSGQQVVGCSGCSEQVRVVWQDGPAQQDGRDDAGGEGGQREEAGAGSDDQPTLSPWELGSITTIEQSAGKAPARCTYDLGRDSFTQGEIWIYRPVWEAEYLGGPVAASWPPSLPGWQQLS